MDVHLALALLWYLYILACMLAELL